MDNADLDTTIKHLEASLETLKKEQEEQFVKTMKPRIKPRLTKGIEAIAKHTNISPEDLTDKLLRNVDYAKKIGLRTFDDVMLFLLQEHYECWRVQNKREIK